MKRNIKKYLSIALTVVMILNPAIASALVPSASSEGTTTSYYLSKAGEGISTGISSVANGFSNIANSFSSAGENLSLAGITLATEISNSITSTAESVKQETVNLAVETKDAVVGGAESAQRAVITYARDTRDGAVGLKVMSVEAVQAFTNSANEFGIKTAKAVTNGAQSLAQIADDLQLKTGAVITNGARAVLFSINRTNAGTLSYLAETFPSLTMSHQSARTAKADAKTPTAPQSLKKQGMDIVKRTELLDSVLNKVGNQLAAVSTPFPSFSSDFSKFSQTFKSNLSAFIHSASLPSFSAQSTAMSRGFISITDKDVPSKGPVGIGGDTVREPSASNGAGPKPVASSNAGGTSGTVTERIVYVSAPAPHPIREPAASNGASPVASLGTVFEDILALRLQQLENKLTSRISALSASSNAQAAQTYQVIAQTNKIDQLSGTSISSATITGSSFSGSSVSATGVSTTDLSAGNATSTNLFATTASSTNLYSTSAAFGVLSANSAAIAGSLSVSGAFSQAGLISLGSGFISNASSTITSGLFSMNGGASTTNITASGIGYFTTATTTNLFSTNFNLGTGTLGSATSSNFFSTTASSTNLFSQLATIGTLTLGNALAISNGGTATTTQVTNGVNYFDGTRITSGTALTYDGTKLTAPYASSTALSVSGVGYFGTASTTNLTVSSLTANRVPYITTAGVFTDSANLMFDGTTLTALNLTSSGNVSLGNATTTNFFSSVASSTNLFSQSGTIGALTANTLTVTGQTTLATSLSGLLQGASGVVSAIIGTAGQFTYYNGTNTLLATSSLFLATSGNVGIGTTTPYSRLSVWGADTGATSLFELTNSASTTIASVLNDGTFYMKGNVGIG
ncbi:MAG: hypothetical protein Q7S05_04105, partial [bacterium]|nr:hypothetical protein [bacterium]